MAIQKNFLGEKRNELKRVEIYISNGVYNKLAKAAAIDGRTTKNFLEKIVNEKAAKIK